MALTSGLWRAFEARRFTALSAVFVAALAALILLGASRATSNDEWLVLAASGEAAWRAGPGQGDWLALELNGRVPDGAEIRTGSTGSVVVAQGLDRVEIHPATTLVVAARAATRARMQIDQTSGRATYTVEKRPAGTFSVHTPYLVAVVKGTKFDVAVSGEETSVSVAEGRVGVSDSRSGASVDVNPGEKASARAQSPGLELGRHSANATTPAEDPATSPDEAAGTTGSESRGAGGAGGSGGTSGGDSGGTSGSSGGATGGVGEAAGDAAGGAGEAVGDATGDVGEAVEGALGGVGEAVGEAVGGEVGEAVGGLGEAVGDTVGGLGGGLGGGFGGKD